MSVFMGKVQSILAQRKCTLKGSCYSSANCSWATLCKYTPPPRRFASTFTSIGNPVNPHYCSSIQRSKLLSWQSSWYRHYVNRFLVTFLLSCPFVKRHVATLPLCKRSFRSWLLNFPKDMLQFSYSGNFRSWSHFRRSSGGPQPPDPLCFKACNLGVSSAHTGPPPGPIFPE